MSLFSSNDSLAFTASENSLLYDVQQYCNYPEISKSRSKRFINFDTTCSVSSDSSSSLPSLVSDVTEPSSRIDFFHEQKSNTSLENYLFSSNRTDSFNKEEEEELDEESEEESLYEAETDSCSSKSKYEYTVFKKLIMKDVHTQMKPCGDPDGWIKFSMDMSPWSHPCNDEAHQNYKMQTLTHEIIAANSSEISSLPDTKAIVLTRLCLTKMELEDINMLSEYKYFRYIDVSWNNLTNIGALSNSGYLMYLNASHNKLTDVLNMKPPWFLVHVELSCNEIKEIGDNLQNFWSLRHLDLSYNLISKIEGLDNLHYLKYLNLSHNHIEKVENLKCTNLDELNLEYNNISDFDMENEGLQSLETIKLLNFNHNKITSLLPFKKLDTMTSLILSYNCVEYLNELSYLSDLPKLDSLNMEHNLVCHSPGYRDFVIYKSNTLKILDNVLVTCSERVSAKLLFQPDIFTSVQCLRTKIELWNQLSQPRIDLETKPYDESPIPILLLVGTFGNLKEDLASMLVQKYPNQFYKIKKHTTMLTDDSEHTNLISISMDEFNNLIKNGELLFHYKEVGHFFGVCRNEICNLIVEGKIGIIETVLEAALIMRLTSLHPYMILCVAENVGDYTERLNNLYEKLKLWNRSESEVFLNRESSQKTLSSKSSSSTKSFSDRASTVASDQSVEDATEKESHYGFDQCDPDFEWTWSLESTISTVESEPDPAYLNMIRGRDKFVHETLQQQSLYVEFNNSHPETFQASVLTDDLETAFKLLEMNCLTFVKQRINQKVIGDVKSMVVSTPIVKERISFLTSNLLSKTNNE